MRVLYSRSALVAGEPPAVPVKTVPMKTKTPLSELLFQLRRRFVVRFPLAAQKSVEQRVLDLSADVPPFAKEALTLKAQSFQRSD